MRVKQVELNGLTKVEFTTKSCEWLVKNFTDGDIYVSFDKDAPQDEWIKIQSGMGQVVVENTVVKDFINFTYKAIYVNGTGTIEVQQLCYR